VSGGGHNISILTTVSRPLLGLSECGEQNDAVLMLTAKFHLMMSAECHLEMAVSPKLEDLYQTTRNRMTPKMVIFKSWKM
jgi:hypothetical protein